MPTYDLCGSVRITATTEDEALDIMDKLVSSGLIEDYHINEIEIPGDEDEEDEEEED